MAHQWHPSCGWHSWAHTFHIPSFIFFPTGLAPLCENMPSGKANKPGDVVRAKNGKTIQVCERERQPAPSGVPTGTPGAAQTHLHGCRVQHAGVRGDAVLSHGRCTAGHGAAGPRLGTCVHRRPTRTGPLLGKRGHYAEWLKWPGSRVEGLAATLL